MRAGVLPATKAVYCTGSCPSAPSMLHVLQCCCGLSAGLLQPTHNVCKMRSVCFGGVQCLTSRQRKRPHSRSPRPGRRFHIEAAAWGSGRATVQAAASGRAGCGVAEHDRAPGCAWLCVRLRWHVKYPATGKSVPKKSQKLNDWDGNAAGLDLTGLATIDQHAVNAAHCLHQQCE